MTIEQASGILNMYSHKHVLVGIGNLEIIIIGVLENIHQQIFPKNTERNEVIEALGFRLTGLVTAFFLSLFH